ncbi:DUF1212-domain-containing protein [Bimuria novae-zelandiae CBS 107.79]|uniref:DUF1212-domain-containing protein n=1 Tax=Bimuria novae-zelandiae CBS 107.79 TaxID=1447943 RepID=A0A6A5VJ04_9PLEO|nr:DUF1212-domain-containing protein [Bimuria novae-zelandiae CBS 107.79]
MSAPGRKRVGFSEETNTSPQSPPNEDSPSWGHNTPLQRADVSHEELAESVREALAPLYDEPVEDIQKPRPAIRKAPRTPPRFEITEEQELEDFNAEKKRSGLEAQKRAAKLSKSVGTYSAPLSRRNSTDSLPNQHIEDSQFPHSGHNSDVSSDGEDDGPEPEHMKQARQLFRQHTLRAGPNIKPEDLYHSEGFQDGTVTPANELEIEDEHVPRPTKFRTGVLGTLLKASHSAAGISVPHHKAAGHGRYPSTGTLSGASTAANTPSSSPPASGTSTPRFGKPWLRGHNHSSNHSVTSVSRLIESSSMLATPAQKDMSHEMEAQYKKLRPGMGKRQGSDNSITTKAKRKTRKEEEYKIKIHLAGTLARQNYLRKLCKALMMYGAPTHRLEEYMSMSARVLEIEAQFLYMPGCMICAFDDSSVHTSEVKLVRTDQGVDLGKLRDVHEIYKDVVHDRIGVEEAVPRLDAITARKPKFNRWLRVPVYGLASACVGPFAFQARPIDLPFSFLLGCLLGWLQLVVSPGNPLLSNVFEIGAAVVTSFFARALGSIPGPDGHYLFCFSAMAQSSIALILPGFTVLCASLELQSKHLVAGSVRMVYAIIYSLFLGFGITIGTVLFGLMYKDATSETQCRDPMSSHFYYLFVVGFSICLMIINQAKYKQMPMMAVIALVGYVVNFHSSSYFKSNAQVSNTLGALAIGIAANLQARFGRHVENWWLDFFETHIRPRYSRLRKRYLRSRHGAHYRAEHHKLQSHSRSSSMTDFVPHTRKIGYGLAAATMLPAIFVQVPSGLSVQGSLVSGINSADQIVRNTTGNATTVTAYDASGSLNSVALNVGFSVIQIAIGITVGLFLAALIVYPLGKRRSGLFSF